MSETNDLDMEIGPIDAYDAMIELERELTVRRRVYPRWVSDRKLSASLADSRIASMEIARKICAAKWRELGGESPAQMKAREEAEADLFGGDDFEAPGRGKGAYEI